MITKKVVENGIYGLAIADALGVPYEFSNRAKMITDPCVDFVGGKTHGKPAGTWSDDTSLTLASLDGLAKMKTESDYGEVMKCFAAWLNHGMYSVDGVFDVGGSCMEAILKYSRGFAPLKCGGCEIHHNGNGSIMRILPAILFSLSKNCEINYTFIDDMSALTHGHEISKNACRIYANIVKAILKKCSKDEIIEIVSSNEYAAFERLKSKDFYSLPECEIRSGGYVVETLEAALWCFLNTKNYKDCVLKAVNLGSDTDTVAAVAGSFAGLCYGKETIPTAWIETLRGKDIIEEQIDKFCSRLIF